MNIFGSQNPNTSKDTVALHDWRDHPAVLDNERRITEATKRHRAAQVQYEIVLQDVVGAAARYDEAQKLFLQGAATRAERDAAKQALQDTKAQVEPAEDALSEAARDQRLLQESRDEVAHGAKLAAMDRLREQYTQAVKDLIDALTVFEVANKRVRQIHEAAQSQFGGPLTADGNGYPTAAGLPALAWDELMLPDPAAKPSLWGMPARDSQSQLARWLPEAKQFVTSAEQAIKQAQKENKAS